MRKRSRENRWRRWESHGSFLANPKHSKNFANRVFRHVARLNGTAYKVWNSDGKIIDGDYPLRYPERGWTGLVAAALLAINPCVLGELPVERGKKEGERGKLANGAGRADYWTYFDDASADIALELKWHHFSLRGKSKNHKDIKSRWDEVTGQARQALAYMKKPSSCFTDPIAIATLVLFVHETVNDAKDGGMGDADSKLEEILDFIDKSHHPWVGIWRPPGGAAILSKEKGKFERCPAIYFLSQSYC